MVKFPTYLLTMADFRNYLREQRALLKRQLADLDTAEKLYQRSQREEGGLPPDANPEAYQWPLEPRTIKQMIVRALEEGPLDGLTPLQLLEQIREHWMPTLQQGSIAPQLTSLNRANIIYRDKGMVKLVREASLIDSGPSDSTDGPVDDGDGG